MVIPSVSVWAEPESTSLNATPGGMTSCKHSAADLVDPSIHTTQGTGAQGKTPGRPHTLSSERGSPPPCHVQGRNAAENLVEISLQQTQESSGSDGTPLNSEVRTIAMRRATRRARKTKRAILRYTGNRRQIGVQAEASTCSTTTQTDISLPQRVDVVWQSHMIGPSAYVDSRAPDEDSGVEAGRRWTY